MYGEKCCFNSKKLPHCLKQVVNRSVQLTDQNFSELKGESEKFSEHSRKTWKCWMWMILFVVLITFIGMW